MRRPDQKLNLDERQILAQVLRAKVTKTKIAKTLRRGRSTIHREIKRNWWHDNLRKGGDCQTEDWLIPGANCGSVQD